MRALKSLLIIVVAVLGLGGILGLLGPKRTQVTRSVVIKAPRSMVMARTATAAQMAEWVPWNAQKAGGQPAVNRGVERLEVVPGEAGGPMSLRIWVDEPMDAEASVDLLVMAMGDSTEATWIWSTNNDFLDRIRFMVNEVEPWVAPGLEQGLAQLKALVEKDRQERDEAEKAKVFRGVRIETVEQPALAVMGRRATVKWDELDGFLAGAFEEAGQAMRDAGLAITGNPVAFYYSWDTVGHRTDVFAGRVLAADTVSELAGSTLLRVPAGSMLVVEFFGAHEGAKKAYAAMEDMMRAKGLEQRHAPFEEYVRGGLNEPDTAKWLMRICWPVE